MKKTVIIATFLSIYSTVVFAEKKDTIRMCQAVGVSCMKDSVSQTLPGAFIKTEIELPSHERVFKMREELLQSDRDGLADLLRVSSHKQLGARLSGLALCKELGFESIGAVVWDIKLRGVHCLDRKEERSDFLFESTAALCAYRFPNAPSLMKRRAGACGIQMDRYQNHSFEVTIMDETFDELPVAGSATDATYRSQNNEAFQ